MIEEHHERYDGKGYPFGKCGEEIHLYARIMALADSFDAMVSDRPYREGLGRDRAIKIIREEAGSQFDPKIVEAFNQVVDRPIGIIPFESFEMSSQPIIFLDNLFGSDAAGVQKIGSMHSEGKPQ
jgi:response regulator RpfG family c-di-GMP phosphodiesterase